MHWRFEHLLCVKSTSIKIHTRSVSKALSSQHITHMIFLTRCIESSASKAPICHYSWRKKTSSSELFSLVFRMLVRASVPHLACQGSVPACSSWLKLSQRRTLGGNSEVLSHWAPPTREEDMHCDLGWRSSKILGKWTRASQCTPVLPPMLFQLVNWSKRNKT